MKIHIIKTEDVDAAIIEIIYERIREVKGPVEFIWEEGNSIHIDEKKAYLTWTEIFGYCDQFREKNKLNEDEVVVLFTDRKNEKNYFAAWDERAALNFFIHSSGYEGIIDADPIYPLIYELASIPLVIAAFDNMNAAEEYAHQDSRGCVFDFTKNKKEAQLRLRTADICDDCRNLMVERKADPPVLRQTFDIFDNIRAQMLYRARFGLLNELSRLTVVKYERALIWNDANVSVMLSPVQMALYHLLIVNEEGIGAKKLDEFKDELFEIYKLYSRFDNEVSMLDPIKSLIDLSNRGALYTPISKINTKIELTIGKQICKHYQIINQKTGVYKISIDRKKVRFVDDFNQLRQE